MRIILYTGKGGVGKTSISSASGLKISEEKKTIILSTDMAHSLTDSFGIKSENEEVMINDNLKLIELNPVSASKKAWGNLHEYLKELIMKNSNSSIEFDEMLLFPGFDDLFSLLKILEIYKENKCEVLIVDCAPTGETLSLLSFGEKINVFANSIVPLLQNFTKGFGNLISKKTSVPKPKDIVFEEFKILSEKLSVLDKILHNKDITSIRIVTNLEDIVLSEAKRNYSYLKLYDYGIDSIYINKLYPKEFLTNDFIDLYEKQEKSLTDVYDYFKDIEIFTSYLKNYELNSQENLKKLANEIYNEKKAYQIFSKKDNYFIKEEHGTRILNIELPIIDKAKVNLERENDDLIINYMNQSRRFSLDAKLKNREISKYKYEEPYLKIYMDY